MNDTKKKKKKTKQKQKIKTFVITLIVFLAIIAIVTAACVKCGKRGNTPNNNPISSAVNINEYIGDDEYLKINAEDCTIYVDSVIKLTCSSNPVEYSMGVSWTSSDTSILTITYDGTVTAIKEGIAVVTATHGVMSSSIIINVIDKEAAPDEDFPIYTPVIPDVSTAPGGENNTTAGNVTTSSQSGGNENQSQEQGTTSVSTPDETTGSQNQPTTQDNPATQPVPTQPGTTAPLEGPTVNIKDNIVNSLSECGFSSYIGDTYVFEEDGNYLGQVIVESDFTQLYVMTRTTYFDSKIKEFLATVLPTGHTITFNNLVNSQKDMTFYADGHKVRVIASPNGGHSQLIIYY